MNLTARKLSVIQFVCRYYVVTREMIQRAVMPETSDDGRVCRKVLAKLVAEGLIAKANMLMVNPNSNAPARAYYPTKRGAELLAVELRDDGWLNTCTSVPNWQHLPHWIRCSEFHVVLDRAAELNPQVKIERFLHEWAIANPNESDPAKRYRLFTEIRKEPRLVCAPDFAFLLCYAGIRKVYFGEFDNGTTGIQQIAASKTPGYAALAKEQLHRRHYPDTTLATFGVLHVSISASRRDALRRAIATKEGAGLHLFTAWPEITSGTLLHGDLIYDCEKGPRALVRRVEGGAA